MNYIYCTAAFAGIAWTFYLVGQYFGLKQTNLRFNALSSDRDAHKADADEAAQEVRRLSGHVGILQDLCADIHAYTAGQKSGTAQKVARMVKAGLAK